MQKVFEKIKEKCQKCSGIGRSSFVEFLKIIDEVAQEYNNGWIPCSERLPETLESEAKAYLTTNEEGMMGVSYYHHGWSNGYESVFDVIAWQPLPEPYQPKGDKE